MLLVTIRSPSFRTRYLGEPISGDEIRTRHGAGCVEDDEAIADNGGYFPKTISHLC